VTTRARDPGEPSGSESPHRPFEPVSESPKIHGCRKNHIAAAQDNQGGQEIRRGRLSWSSRSPEIHKCRIDHISEKSDEQ